MVSEDDAVRARALTLLHGFCARLLPGTVRRIAAWKRLPRAGLRELEAEVAQELAVDCLEHARQIVALPPAARHARWMRAAERWIYRQRVARRGCELGPDLAAPAIPAAAAPPPGLPELVALGNGRSNLTATAARTGVRVRTLQRRLGTLARELGCDAAHDAFWRRRLVEALTGLAVDLLRDRGGLLLLPRPRPAPDPAARRQRLRRLQARFQVRPATLPERTLLRRWVRADRLDGSAPRQLLVAALQLDPGHAAAWLWLFEACVAGSDLRAAAQALRRARQLAAPPRLAVALARARLLEARGRTGRALAALGRAAQRWPGERALAAVAAQLVAVSGSAR